MESLNSWKMHTRYTHNDGTGRLIYTPKYLDESTTSYLVAGRLVEVLNHPLDVLNETATF